MGKKHFVALILAFGFAVIWPPEDIWAGDYQQAYQQISEMKVIKKRTIKKTVSFQRDTGIFTLEQGDIYIFQPLGKTLNAFYFCGTGKFSFTPPLEAEKDQLLRFYNTTNLELKFSEMLLLFSDSTYHQLIKASDLNEDPLLKFDADKIDFFLRYIREKKGKYYPPEIMKAVLDEKREGLFWAGIKTKETHPIFFEIDPFDYEEIKFSRGRTMNVYGEYCETINQFSLGADSRRLSDNDQAGKAPVRIESYQMDCIIENNLKMGISCRMRIKSQAAGQNWIYFYLAGQTFTDLTVDSVKWGGVATDFYKDKENTILWVKCPAPLAENQACSLSLYYKGNILDKYYNWLYVKESILWYPHGENKDKTIFDVTFHYPDKYSFVSVGKNVSCSTEGNVTSSRWVIDKPVRNFTFNLGFFKEYKMKEKEVPPITILLNETARKDYQHAVMASGGFLKTGRDMKKQVGADIVNSIAFYQKVYGQCPAEELIITESPYLGGEAFPGMINLSFLTFQNTSNEGDDEILRAHEVAHQWWAQGVDYATYHDRWLSEGLAHFSSLWYMQTVLKDNKLFFKKLELMRDDIMDTRKYLLSSGVRAGAIWLGYRTSTMDTPEDYALLVYYKGAWVIQMLRNMMLDMNTMKEDRFIGAMQEFYQNYNGKNASTEDFEKVMEKHIGRDLDWFFKQWVYGDKIPEYKFSYTTVATPEGKCKLTYRIDQTGVPVDFQMLIPLQFDFGKDQTARTRVLAKGPCTQNELVLPMKPKEVIFNPFSSVLCKQETVSWSY